MTALVTSACLATTEDTPFAESDTPAPLEVDSPVGTDLVVGRPDITRQGNRVIEGRGALDRVEPVDVELPMAVRWALPVTDGADLVGWSVELETGERVLVSPNGTIESGVDVPVGPASGTSEPAIVDALPDGRTVQFDDILVALVGPTDRYPHGVLGDRIEASAVQVVDLEAGTTDTFGPEPPTVIEGLAPIVADIDGDGDPEILVTHSNGEVGAWLAVWSVEGRPVAASAPIGRGNRWRHQLAVAALGPAGEIEIVDVRTPHIGGTVEYFRVEGPDLVPVATLAGFTSHAIGSRNLDMAVVADANGNGSLDVVLPTDDRTELAILTRTTRGVEVVATVELDGRLTTNIGVHADRDGSLGFAAGTDEGMLHIWITS